MHDFSGQHTSRLPAAPGPRRARLARDLFCSPILSRDRRPLGGLPIPFPSSYLSRPLVNPSIWAACRVQTPPPHPGAVRSPRAWGPTRGLMRGPHPAEARFDERRQRPVGAAEEPEGRGARADGGGERGWRGFNQEVLAVMAVVVAGISSGCETSKGLSKLFVSVSLHDPAGDSIRLRNKQGHRGFAAASFRDRLFKNLFISKPPFKKLRNKRRHRGGAWRRDLGAASGGGAGP